jgi:outer membrane lipoprotein-sorting protein
MFQRPSRRLALGVFALVLPAARPAWAVSAADQVLVDKAVAYLDGLASAKARFEQTDSKGHVVEGSLYLARPGRARFEYDPPSGLLITADGKTVAVSNRRLKTLQKMPLSSTPLGLFLADHIRLDRGAQVTRVVKLDGGFSVTARGGRGVSQGEITLYFDEAPLRLTGWAIIDVQGRLTRVSLNGLAPAGNLPDDLFTQTGPAEASSGG